MAVVGHASDSVDNVLHHLLADGVVAAGIVVGSIFLAADQQLGVEELPVVASADLINGRGVEVNEDGAGDMFAVAGLGEEGLERAALDDILGIGVGATVHAEAMLEQVPEREGVAISIVT